MPTAFRQAAQYLFISDLHLSAKHPRLIQGFLQLLQQQTQSTQLYILGDWFNVWIGDDDPSAWLNNIVTALQNFVARGNQVFFLVGNRDFALHDVFLKQFAGHLLQDGHILNIAGQNYRLEHGDALCTDDVAYQRFKRIIRHPLILGFLRHMPLNFRQKLAQGFRKKSREQVQQKHDSIMDVNETAVAQALNSVDVLIHGHTHRPQIHHYAHDKRRIVLGDWRESGDAMLLKIDAHGREDFFRYTF